MRKNALTLALAAVMLLGAALACRQPEPRTAADPDPEMQRALVERGDARAARRTPPQRRPTRTGRPADPAAIGPDILLVGDRTLSVAEVLYPLRERIAGLHASGRAAPAALARLIANQTQQELGTLLLYEEARAEFAENEEAALDKHVNRQITAHVAREFDDSMAKFDRHLARYNLDRTRYSNYLKRWAVAQDYGRRRFMPQVHVRRDELLAHYRQNEQRYCQPETRELELIALPYAAFLPAGVEWSTAEQPVRDAARKAALTQARAAKAALADRGFADVAREFSRGPMAGQGGAWGRIGRPLQPPLDVPSARVFELAAGQVDGPIETDVGVYLVRCGGIEPEVRRSFEEVQAELRRELSDQRLAELSHRHMMTLVHRAQLNSLDAFVQRAVAVASRPDWPDGA